MNSQAVGKMKRSLEVAIAPSLLLVIACALLFAQQLTAQPTAQQLAQQAATQQDHQRMMQLLKITSLRSGVDGRNPEACVVSSPPLGRG